MSDKINLYKIITSHFDTLRDASKEISLLDYVVFYFIPLIFAIIGIIKSLSINSSLLSLLVNFGSIFTALLFSVLVLIYDQKSKIENAKILNETQHNRVNIESKNRLYETKVELINELFHNISYSIFMSIFLVLVCFLQELSFGKVIEFSIADKIFTLSFDIYLITPLIIIITTNLFLTVLMIIKRMHGLLTN